MTKLDYIVLEFLKTMMADLKLRSYDEEGERKEETLGRVEELKELIERIKSEKTR